MPEQYDSSHTGEVIDEKIQSLIDFETINEGSLTPGLLGNNGIISNVYIDAETPENSWFFIYNEHYNFMRYSVIGNICFITFHLKINVTRATNLHNNNKYAILKGLPFNSLYDTSFSIYELCNLKDFQENDFVQFGVITVQQGANYIRLENANGQKAAIWQEGDTWIGGSGFYFIQN